MSENNKEKYEELVDILKKLMIAEKEYDEIEGKIGKVLDSIDNVDDEYEELLDEKYKIKSEVANRNKKSMILETFFLMITTLIMFILAKIILIDLFNILPKVFHVIYGGIIGFTLCYEVYMNSKEMWKDDKLYDGLDEDDRYLDILKQIKAKEKEMRALDKEYESLYEKRDELLCEVRCMYTLAYAFNDDDIISKAMEEIKEISEEVENNQMEDNQDRNRLVRRRGIGHRH